MAGHPRVLVLGSVARSIMLVPSTREPGTYDQSDGWVGAPLIRDMIRHALVEIPARLAGDSDRKARDAEETRQFEAFAGVVRPDPPDTRTFRVQDNCVGITTVSAWYVAAIASPRSRVYAASRA